MREALSRMIYTIGSGLLLIGGALCSISEFPRTSS
jgi:hypothetical protein